MGLGAIVTFFFINNALSRLYVRVFEDKLLPVLAGETDHHAETSHHARVIHTDLLLCSGKPNAMEIPKSEELIAIMLPSGGCTPEEKAKNAINNSEESKIGYILMYESDIVDGLISRVENNNEFSTFALFKISEKIDSSSPHLQLVSLSRLNENTAQALLQLRHNQATTVLIQVRPDKFTALPRVYKILCMFLSLAVWAIIIPTISFVVTRRMFRNSLSFEVGWSGVMIAYEGNDDEEYIDPKQLLTKEQVLSLTEVVFGGPDTCAEKNISEHCTDDGSFNSSSTMDIENPCFHNSTCSICIEDFSQGERLRVLPCGHYFHTECISKYSHRSFRMYVSLRIQLMGSTTNLAT